MLYIHVTFKIKLKQNIVSMKNIDKNSVSNLIFSLYNNYMKYTLKALQSLKKLSSIKILWQNKKHFIMLFFNDKLIE